MNNKIVLILIALIGLATSSSAQRRTTTSSPAPEPATTKPVTARPPLARLTVQGTYEETFQGSTNAGNAEGSLAVKFETARWLTMETNEAGKAEFSDWDDAPAPDVSGSVSYHGSVKGGSGGAAGGDRYQAESSFFALLSEDDLVLTVPEYSDAGDGLTMTISIQPAVKGKCSTVTVRNGKTTTSSGCDNRTFFITTKSPPEIADNDDPAKTSDTPNLATFEIEMVVEPEIKTVSNTATAGSSQSRAVPSAVDANQSAADAGVSVWRGAVTTGTKEAGFKITLTKTQDLPSNDKRGKITRKLNFTATIVPGAPK